MNNNLKIPSFDELMQPAINALVSLGGSGSIAEIYEEVLELEGFSDEVTTVLHNPEKSSQTAVSYRLAWARTYLKKAGYLDNSARGVWALTDKTKKDSVDVPEEALEWREQVHQILIEQMSPDGFERLTQRLLRESGFVHVEVTGRTGDGGIDGRGIARVGLPSSLIRASAFFMILKIVVAYGFIKHSVYIQVNIMFNMVLCNDGKIDA